MAVCGVQTAEDHEGMDSRREIMGALAQLRPNELRQLCLYLLEEDPSGITVIDKRKWGFHEYLDASHLERVERLSGTVDELGHRS
jgi:hypothetical protein